MRGNWYFFFLLLFGAFIAGCGSGQSLIVLVPDPDGTVGGITVSNQAGSVDLDKANQATVVEGENLEPQVPVIMEKEKISSIFSEILAIQPTKPARFILYFETDSTALKSDSKKMLSEIVTMIHKRRSVNISVVGHTDTISRKAYALKLSQERAEEVSRLLIQKGIKKETIVTTSHGGENPLIKEKSLMGNPKNRRVEVIVR